MSQSDIPRPDTDAILEDLKDFQCRTVDHVHRRFFLDESRTDRFLVADEVGLGKTLVARGVTALALDELWESTDRIDVIYICSNSEIAQQNLNRLKVVEGIEYARPTRLTLLPRAINDMREQKLNFVSLTPGTSFNPHSSMGVGQERALLYLMLWEPWELGERKPPLNIFCGGMSRGGFEDWIEYIEDQDDIDPKLEDQFLQDLQRAEADRANRREPTLRARFEELRHPFRRGQRNRVDEEARYGQRTLIRDLRAQLARSCVDALEPDVVILDEFQRFKHLLSEENEAGELARQLFEYRDPRTGQPAKTLLLSATPYKSYATAGDPDGTDHYEDFVETVRFLLNDAEKTENLRDLFEELRLALVRWDGRALEKVQEVRQAIETSLRQVIARTERQAASADRNGMLRQVRSGSLELQPSDIRAYIATQKVARVLDHHDTLEYWKSSPYLLNLMDQYKLKTDLLEEIEDRSDGEIASAMKDADEALMKSRDVAAYRNLDPGNARMRDLSAQTIELEAWKLLWLPPTLPYYALGGPFANPGLERFTKRLAFSSWAVVPKAISVFLSYEAERRMALDADKETQNSVDARKERSGRLQFSASKDRLTGMPVLALLYPSFALAELTDPLKLAAASNRLTAEEAVALAANEIRPALERLRSLAGPSGPRERWYWAAPFLLDARRDQELTLDWLGSSDVVEVSRAEEKREGESRWRDHLDQAAQAVQGGLELGPFPDDLPEVLARLSIAAPGVASLRALTRSSMIGEAERDPGLRIAALNAAWAFRSLFNLPEVYDVLQATQIGPIWRRALDYCVDGGLQAVLDEYVHVLKEYSGHIGKPMNAEIAGDVADAMSQAIGIRTTRANVDFFKVRNGRVRAKTERMRARFALRFGDQQGEDDKVLARADHVRTAFNSPFWPFVMATTSVGQEGLDFHLYCHAVVHWNLPSNPVDLEQREGRIHRYKGHAIRRNLARAHGDEALREAPSDPWQRLFELGEQDRPEGESELWPYWIYTGERNGADDSNGEEPAMIERHVPALPLSRDRIRLDHLRRALTLYRSVLGQPRQEDLVRLLTERVPKEEWDRYADLLRIDLSPPAPERHPAKG